MTFVAAESRTTDAEAVVKIWGDDNGIEIWRRRIRDTLPKPTMFESFFYNRSKTKILTFPEVNMSCASFYSELKVF